MWFKLKFLKYKKKGSIIMIKIKEYENILKSVYHNDVLQTATNLFASALKNDNSTNLYVQDFLSMGLP